MSEINLINVAKYYGGKPHQDKALEYLQQNIDKSVLKKFEDLWRVEVRTIESRILSRLKTLGIQLDEGINIIGLEGCNLDYSVNDDYALRDEYNDLVLVTEYNKAKKFTILNKAVATTEPGIFYTKFRLNLLGAARIEIDSKQNRIWEVGAHKKQYPALIQTGGMINVKRDNNEDFSREGDNQQLGFFGIN